MAVIYAGGIVAMIACAVATVAQAGTFLPSIPKGTISIQLQALATGLVGITTFLRQPRRQLR